MPSRAATQSSASIRSVSSPRPAPNSGERKTDDAFAPSSLGDNGNDSLSGQGGQDFLDGNEGVDTLNDASAAIDEAFVLAASVLAALEA